LLGHLLGRLIGWPLWIIIAKLSATQPRISDSRGSLVAASSWRTTLFSLGAYHRRIVFDTGQRAIRIRDRRFWLVKWRHIPFATVKKVRYTHQDISPWSRLSFIPHQELDSYTISVCLTGGEEVALCRFCGAGDFVNAGWRDDSAYWAEELLSELSQGTQDTESRIFARRVAGLLGVGVERRLL
jgi:hypothetical protein